MNQLLIGKTIGTAYDLEDFELSIKVSRSKRRIKTDVNCERIFDKSRSRQLKFLSQLPLTGSSIEILSKLIINHQIASVEKVLSSSKHSIILQGKINTKHKKFTRLYSDDVIIKVMKNDEHQKLNETAQREFANLKEKSDILNCPIPLIKSGHIVVMTMIGENGQPANTLKEVISNKEKKREEVLEGVLEFWHTMRYKKFDPTHYLCHDNKWWIISFGNSMIIDIYGPEAVDFDRKQLRKTVKFFKDSGMTLIEITHGFFQFYPKYNYYSRWLTKGIFWK